MLYCTKCRTLAPDSTRACPNCRRSRALRPVRAEDEVFFLKVSETEAGEMERVFEEQAVRYSAQPVRGGLAAGVYDPEYLPGDREIYVAYADLERANALFTARDGAKTAETDGEEEMPKGRRMLIQTVSILAFLILVTVTVLCTDALANWIRSLFG